MTRALLCVVLAGCAPRYFVASVHNSGGRLVVEKCAFAFNGRPTDDCHEETIDPPPDPAEVRKLDAPVALRPAPVSHVEQL
jgi:hypothetical protein